MKLLKIILATIVVVTGLFLILTNFDLNTDGPDSIEQQTENMSDGQRLVQLVRSDLERLAQENLLPLELQNLSEVSLTSHSERAKEWIVEQNFNNIFKQSKEGKYNLQIDLLEWSEGEKNGAILQFNLLENSTKNKIWEISRSYDL